MSDKKDTWYITSSDVTASNVIFEDVVDRETAMRKFMSGDYVDIISEEHLDTLEVSDAQ